MLADGIRLICADCRDVLPTLGKVDAVVTSPPYPGADMWKSNVADLTALNLDVLKACVAVVRDNGVICWQIADVPAGDHGVITTTTTTYAATRLGLKLRAQIVWDKAAAHLPPPCFMRRPVVPALTHEWVLVFFKGAWVPRELQSGVRERGKMTSSVWRIAPEADRTHIAPFPIMLARRMVDFWSLENETVLDPFAGAGTTGVACVQLERSFVGVELHEPYFDMACRRINAELKKPSFFTNKPKRTKPAVFFGAKQKRA